MHPAYFKIDYSELLFTILSQTKSMCRAKTLHLGLTHLPYFCFDSSKPTLLMIPNTQVQVHLRNADTWSWNLQDSAMAHTLSLSIITGWLNVLVRVSGSTSMCTRWIIYIIIWVYLDAAWRNLRADNFLAVWRYIWSPAHWVHHHWLTSPHIA